MNIHTYHRQQTVGNYELLRDVQPNAMRAYAKHATKTTTGTLLDLGCGTGELLAHIAEQNTPNNLVGIDTSKEMITQAKKHLPPHIQLHHTTLAKYKQSHKDVDAIHFKALLHCVNNPTTYLQRIADSVRPQGHIITGHEYSQSEDEIEQIGKHPINDEEIHRVFTKYFTLREQAGKPFEKRSFPAGDSSTAAQYLEKKTPFTWVEQIRAPELHWQRNIRIQDILNAMKNATFQVFYKGLTKNDRETLDERLQRFCKEEHIDVHKQRTLQCEYNINILQRI